MKSFNKWGLVFLLLTVLLLAGGEGAAAAAPLSLEEAVRWGWEHSPAIQSLTDSLTMTDLTIDSLLTNLGWNLSLAGDTSYGKMSLLPEELSAGQGQGFTLENQPIGQWGLALQGSKSFLWGLSLQSKVSVRDDFSLDHLDDTVNFTLSASQQVFPRIVIKAEEELYAARNTLKKTRLNLEWQKGWKAIDWIEAYLNIIRLQQRLRLEEKNLQLAQATLTQVLEEAKIGEAGEQKVLSAQLSVKQSEYRLLQTRQLLAQNMKTWYQDINLPAGREVQFLEDAPFLHSAREQSSHTPPEAGDPVRLMERVSANHYQMKANQLDQAFARQQLQWHQRTGLPQVSIKGNYDYQKDNWSIGINASYNLLDGGSQRVTKASDQAQIDRLQEEYATLTRSLQVQLETYLDQYELALLQAEEKRLAMAKGRLEEQLAGRQYDAQVITANEYQQKQLAFEQTRIDLAGAEDAVMIAKLRWMYLCGTENLF